MAFVEMKNISKAFGTVKANENVCFDAERGEIHALLGENGSGKSTLMNMLSGLYAPDEGSIFIEGKQVVLSSPADAIAKGVGMVHQHFMLVEVLSATENIAAGSKNGLFIKRRELGGKIRAVAEKYGLAIDPDKKIYEMSVGEKQTVEIVKMLYRGASVLILDEPTAVLTPQETGVLFSVLRNMKEQGCVIILITHKLSEVMEISDRVTVLRQGRKIGTVKTGECTAENLIEMMVGRPVDMHLARAAAKRSETPVLTVRDLSVKGSHGRDALSGVSFDVHGGEILGVAGIAGSGQRELCESVAGLIRAERGSVRFKDEEILGLSPVDIMRRGVSMSFVPEDRLGVGLAGGMSIAENVMLRSYQRKKGVFLDRAEGKKIAARIVKRYDVSTPSVAHIVKKLSGGNIQKVLLGREVDSRPSLLITAYPVRGLDIGASYHVYDILNGQKKAGVAILFIGEDLDILLQLCDRLMVLCCGRVMATLDPKHTTKEEVGRLMLGQRPDGEEGIRCIS